MIQLKHSNFDDIVGKEDLNPIFNWLDENIWKKASIKFTDKLTTEACNGSTLNVNHFKNHLESRYLS
jgi:carboxypeptidase Taq